MIPPRLILALALLTVLAACPEPAGPPTVGTFDLSRVPDARFGEDYAGQVAVTDYDGPARYTLNGGVWPQGLSMDAAGRITGSATWVETKTVEVLASGLDGIADFVGDVTVAVTTEFTEGVFIGYEHDQLNNMIDYPGVEYMSNIWVRLTGAGTQDMSEWTMRPGVYLPGEDGEAKDGRGDDVRIGDIAFADLDWAFEEWTPTIEENTYPADGYPSKHLPEGETPTVSEEGVFAAGSDGGEGDFTATHPDYSNTIQKKFQVVPPDWCPNGWSNGGYDADGACEYE